MAIKKELKVTTNKVLQYNISKDGYKTISGSKIIDEDSILNIQMIETSSSELPYTIGDRIGGCATFFGYFDSINPETKESQKYACFVLDAKYRSIWVWSGTQYKSYGTPIYTNITDAKNAKESATYNTTIAIDYLNNGGYYYSRNPNGTSLIINVGDKFYSPQLPNVYELQQIWDNRTTLDNYDPTLNDYPTRSLVGWGKSDATYSGQKSVMTSTQSYYDGAISNFAYQVSDGWIYQYAVLGNNINIFPIFEIPVEG